ncbi:MAG: hypothetical protein H7308_18540 [Chthonomonadaceae bacterium]|nr:hypothetical protein [Chthonomonadaceae bacterium]
MEWQAAVFALQIMIITVSWMLFQRAKGELSAKAAEAPILNEVKALHRNVKQLLSEITEASHRTSVQLEAQCNEARTLLAEMEARTERERHLAHPLSAIPLMGTQTISSPSPTLTVVETYAPKPKKEEPPYSASRNSARHEQRRLIYSLADAGASASEISREAEISEGEVETLLALRSPVRA